MEQTLHHNRYREWPSAMSKRRRGPDGRYILLSNTESPRGSGNPGPQPNSAERSMGLRNTVSPAEEEQNDPVRRSNGATTERTSPHQDGSPNAQPSVVGESWYASYDMRGYTPGHTSVHRPIGECSETVQNVTRETRRESVSCWPSVPSEKTDLSDLPSLEQVDRLIKFYFERFHMFCPIVRKRCFLSSLEDGTLSGTLLRSVLFVASLHCDIEVLHLMGYSTRWDANNALYNKASAAFDADHETSRAHMILSSYLLHYWFGSPTAYRDCHWWLAAAIRSAQCTGYHRSTKNSKMSQEEKSRWKRIWWCLYVRDRQIAISTGTPMVINDDDHDVEELLEGDFPDEPPEIVQYIIAQRLQRQFTTSNEVKPVLDAAAQIFNLVENSLLFWTPEHFPMIYVSALFSAMMALAVDIKTAAPQSDQIFNKIRPGLLALKQFESVYILARWIKNFFMDILNRSLPNNKEDAERASQEQSLADGPPNTEIMSSSNQIHDLPTGSELPDQANHQPSGYEDTTLMYDQDCGMEGGGFWPMYMANGVFSGVPSSATMDFPHPDSFQYQAMYFLADLGISTADGTNAEVTRNFIFDSESNIQAACQEFARILGPENVSTERADLVTHSGSDYQSYAWTEESAILSHVVLYPETTEQVSELMKICFRRRLPVTPYSGGTSIEGQYIPHLQGICVDFGRMNNIVELNKDDLDCVVQPGIGWMDLNEELAGHGLFFPPDPGPGAMIGGMVGTGCSGTNAAAYGTMKDWVLSLTVVLGDGTVIKTRQRARKSSAGYDLTRTFIGSEGTLGLVTEATLKLAVRPPCEAVAVCTFPTLRDAASAVRDVMSNGIQVAAVEILDEVQMKSINDSALTKLKWKEEPTLFFKFTGSDEFIVQHLAKQVGSITKQNRSTTYTFASDETERNELWSARKNALWSMLSMRKSPNDKVWTTDVAVPLSRLPDIIEFAKADIERSGLLGSIVGHVGDGNFHTLLLFPEEKRHVAEEVVHRMVDKAIEMKGTATGEHGVGLVKRDYLEKELGKEAVDAMRSMKNAFDPLCILNCDKVIRMQTA
ncbi:d-lactate dehydrogenase (cytochrome) [Fusarium beomiforme]|uniref:D-lactate dehydrogenase (cytochrome) n=1 Tax=Fusarium beomiforme TaxID=44412 RepID=A0A9P5DWV8_9HYPO|nr:d-lactate dehydrogenase (cytochrome) [Fusarium beomiforme]